MNIFKTTPALETCNLQLIPGSKCNLLNTNPESEPATGEYSATKFDF